MQAQDADLADRPIAEIRIEGLERVPEQKVRNQLRSVVGNPFNWDTVNTDVRLLTRLGEFRSVEASAELLPDGSVTLTYTLVEAPIIAEVQVVGNRVINDQDLLAAARLRRGFPRDDFLIENAKRAMVQLYRERGHYLATVTVDESELEETGILFFRVIEGPRVKVKAIEFEGNVAFSGAQLHAEIETRTAVLFFRRGELDTDRLIDDVAALDRFYKDRGYLDVRIGRTIDLSPDSSEVKVTFLVQEGELFTIRSILTDPDPLRVFGREQIAGLIPLKPGDVFSQDKIQRSTAAIRRAYGLMGYVDARVRSWGRRPGGDAPVVDFVLEIQEGEPYKVGLIEVKGNILTQDRVILRNVRLKPGRTFDASEIDRSLDRLRHTRLFND
ncbi:MAG: BamA/OMP85 family outer membrane protein, partial [Planctomycetota bacterium]